MYLINQITAVSFSPYMVDFTPVTLSIKESLKNRFSTFEEAKNYIKSLSYTIITIYDFESRQTITINL